MKYGELPKVIKTVNINCSEMMFYQYLPIKMANSLSTFTYEDRLNCFGPLLSKASADFIKTFGLEEFRENYVYLTVKHLHQSPSSVFNRTGLHSDGFLTDDINYIWSSASPTIFYEGDFNLTLDDKVAIKEMEEQSVGMTKVCYPDNTLVRLNQYNIHKVNDECCYEGMRTFCKISFSKDKYNLIGNSHNYGLSYDWDMKARSKERNIPQAK